MSPRLPIAIAALALALGTAPSASAAGALPFVTNIGLTRIAARAFSC